MARLKNSRDSYQRKKDNYHGKKFGAVDKKPRSGFGTWAKQNEKRLLRVKSKELRYLYERTRLKKPTSRDKTGRYRNNFKYRGALERQQELMAIARLEKMTAKLNNSSDPAAIAPPPPTP